MYKIFFKVTIRNMCEDSSVSVNGTNIIIKRPLLNDSRIQVLDKKFIWIFPTTNKGNLQDNVTETVLQEKINEGEPVTPRINPIVDNFAVAEQAPNSCPN